MTLAFGMDKLGLRNTCYRVVEPMTQDVGSMGAEGAVVRADGHAHECELHNLQPLQKLQETPAWQPGSPDQQDFLHTAPGRGWKT